MKDQLNYCAIDITPINHTWGEGYGETWEYHSAAYCEECGKPVIGRGGEKHCDLDEESECTGYVPSQEGPMMNYYYPLPEFQHSKGLEACTLALVDLPLCIVEFTDNGEYALALTGGGMDLSWEICAAYMACGYLPPAHFCDLPEMAGRSGTSAKDRRIIRACRLSLRGIKARTVSALQRLAEHFPNK